MKKNKSMVLLCTLCVMTFVFSSTLNVFAAEKNSIVTQILSCDDYKISEIKRIEINDDHLVSRLDKIDCMDGLNETEISQISKVANVEIEKRVEGEYQITDYILESTEPLATIKKVDGSVEYYSENVTVRSIVKKTHWKGGEEIIKNAIIQANTKYFWYEADGYGREVRKLYETEAILSGDTENISKIRMSTYAAGVQRFDENGNAENGSFTESLNGHLYTVAGPGLYAEYTGTQYYYSAFDAFTTAYVTVHVTLPNNTISTFHVKVI